MCKMERLRAPIYTNQEKMLFIDIVEKYLDIVECKKSDGESLRAKAAQWEEITTEFNAKSTYMVREVKGLKILWDNLKKKAKLILASERETMFATDGGPAKKIKADLLDEKVISLLKRHSEGPLEADEPNWSNFTPIMLKAPVSHQLLPDDTNVPQVDEDPLEEKISRRRRLKMESDSLAKRKLNALELSCKEASAEHKIKLRILLLQEKQEEEKLKQEILKTKHLQIQIDMKKKLLDNA